MPAGHYRPDAGHLVVVDGLCTEGERAELLAWLTAERHDPSQPPPTDKWEQACVDREGDAPTWGLRQEVGAGTRRQGWDGEGGGIRTSWPDTLQSRPWVVCPRQGDIVQERRSGLWQRLAGSNHGQPACR